MKYCFVLLLLSPFLLSAQDCSLKTTKDPYTREIKVTTGLISLNDAQYSIQATKTEIDFIVSVFFEGTRLKSNFKNGGTTNCDGLFHITFRNTNPMQSALSNLGTKKIT